MNDSPYISEDDIQPLPPEQQSKPKVRKKTTPGEIVRRILLVISILVFLVSAGYLANYFWERWDARQETAGIQKSVGVELNEDGIIESYRPLTREELERLKAINPDFVAWVTIPGTNVNYPVCQAKDNDKYLHTTFEGSNRSAGTIFLDYVNKADFTDMNTVLYGHHMRDKTMFQNLTLLRDQGEFNRIRKVYVQLYSSGDVLEYDIGSVYSCHADYDYRTPNYATVQEKADFLKRITDKSECTAPFAFTVEDRILTLSTCEYDYDDGRLAVHAKLVSQTPLDQWDK